MKKERFLQAIYLHVGYLQALNGGMAKCKYLAQDVSSINVAQPTELVLELPSFLVEIRVPCFGNLFKNCDAVVTMWLDYVLKIC